MDVTRGVVLWEESDGQEQATGHGAYRVMHDSRGFVLSKAGGVYVWGCESTILCTVEGAACFSDEVREAPFCCSSGGSLQ